MVDSVLEKPLAVFAAVLPDFSRFNFADYVSYGFDISGDLLLQCVSRAVGFLLPVFVAGYFFLRCARWPNESASCLRPQDHLPGGHRACLLCPLFLLGHPATSATKAGKGAAAAGWPRCAKITTSARPISARST